MYAVLVTSGGNHFKAALVRCDTGKVEATARGLSVDSALRGLWDAMERLGVGTAKVEVEREPAPSQ